MTATDRRIVAYHEAGHAVVAIVEGVALRCVSIAPCRDTAGHVRPAQRMSTIDNPERLLLMVRAGPAAERKLTGRPARFDGHDEHWSRLFAAVATKQDDEHSAVVDQYIRRYDALADAAMLLHWTWIDRVAALLLRRETIDGSHVADLME